MQERQLQRRNPMSKKVYKDIWGDKYVRDSFGTKKDFWGNRYKQIDSPFDSLLSFAFGVGIVAYFCWWVYNNPHEAFTFASGIFAVIACVIAFTSRSSRTDTTAVMVSLAMISGLYFFLAKFGNDRMEWGTILIILVYMLSAAGLVSRHKVLYAIATVIFCGGVVYLVYCNVDIVDDIEDFLAGDSEYLFVNCSLVFYIIASVVFPGLYAHFYERKDRKLVPVLIGFGFLIAYAAIWWFIGGRYIDMLDRGAVAFFLVFIVLYGICGNRTIAAWLMGTLPAAAAMMNESMQYSYALANLRPYSEIFGSWGFTAFFAFSGFAMIGYAISAERRSNWNIDAVRRRILAECGCIDDKGQRVKDYPGEITQEDEVFLKNIEELLVSKEESLFRSRTRR